MALEEVPERLKLAFLAAEDKRFFEHGGLDLRRIAGALAHLDRRVADEPGSFGAAACPATVDLAAGTFGDVTAGHPPPLAPGAGRLRLPPGRGGPPPRRRTW